MTAHAEQRAFLIAYRKTGEIPDQARHEQYMLDQDYRAAFAVVTREMKHPPKPRKPPKVKIKGKRGQPKKIAAPVPESEATELQQEPPPEPACKLEPEPGEAASTASPVQERAFRSPRTNDNTSSVSPPPIERVIPGKRGYTRIYVRDGQEIEEAEPEAPAKPEPDFVPTVEISVTSDADQKKLIDEYGELDRRMQLRAMDYARYESLKRAIKSWFDQAPADADGTVEGDVYLLHLSCRERERKVRDLRELHDLVGFDKFLELVTVSIGQLENLLGKAHVAALCLESRTGSRRIKAIAKKAVNIN